ncbi:MAG: hypothetical protein F6K36_02795 [Symploca sp. SIO3C6]|uniref:Uncharacterized protein n=1 Tax=Symploca sp. SIO1C4 TaxID=2607765 RepID=A0A6B3NCG5_9CYAN|nr:hypothetical protein [Symploca sp. SIO3C6]NER29357.1 hypothetical protein [Symploca sp. SIO1C4]NET03795.1 hypothetical protein [Symploca sp. SIO2B6]
MVYQDTAVIIPLLATAYLLAIYLLLMVAQRMIKGSRYATSSFRDAYANYGTTEQVGSNDEVDKPHKLTSGLNSFPIAFTEPDQQTHAQVASSTTSKLK